MKKNIKDFKKSAIFIPTTHINSNITMQAKTTVIILHILMFILVLKEIFLDIGLNIKAMINPNINGAKNGTRYFIKNIIKANIIR